MNKAERIATNKAAFKAWGRKNCQKAHNWFWTAKETGYLAYFRPFRIGHRTINWVKWASVDLTAESIFNERGKLRVRFLKSCAPAWVLKLRR
jgi:hypothetical protein